MSFLCGVYPTIMLNVYNLPLELYIEVLLWIFGAE